MSCLGPGSTWAAQAYVLLALLVQNFWCSEQKGVWDMIRVRAHALFPDRQLRVLMAAKLYYRPILAKLLKLAYMLQACLPIALGWERGGFESQKVI